MIAGFLLIAVAIVLIPSSFSLETEVRSVTITSKKLSYEQKDPGSWNIEKSAEWIQKGKARITFDVDTVLKTENAYTDVILVLDVSGSMAGDKLNRVKSDSKELVSSLLSDSNNRVALITFETESSLISKLTNNKDEILNQIDSLTYLGNTNYYQPLIHVDEILKNYVKEENRECIVLFLTDGYPNEDVPNQIAEYSYLKKQYPYLTINGIQYEMGKSILEPIKEISDHQFIADMESLNNVLFEASVTPIPYSNFKITDYLDSNYFEIESIENIQVSQGEVSLTNENGVPKVTWNISYFKSGSSAQMTIDVDLKEEYLEKSGYYPTNQKEEITSQIEEVEENITSQETPILKTPNELFYESNAPEGCQVKNLPENERKWAKEIVEISEEEPSCEGYQFKGWNIVTEGVKRVNDDYFEMPGKDVILRAEWGKVGLSKTMDGEVYVAPPPVMQAVGSYNYNDKLWQYKGDITKIIIQDRIQKPEADNIESWDISEAQDETIMAYYDKENTTIYIQANGKIAANPDSSYLFYGFSKLAEIEGLELLDTSQVINMSYMFYNCSQLTSIDLSGWNTSKVTDMSRMFYECKQLTTLDLSKWDTSQVTNMKYMFSGCSQLTSIDLSGWNPSKVTDMSSMFDDCKQLTSLDLSGWNTSSVTDMNYMFYSCSKLTTLDLSKWDTSQVTNMKYMFNSCSQLTSLDLSSWDTSKVTNMSYMFKDCSQLTNLDSIKDWNTSSVTDMSRMFNGCSQLTSIDLSGWDTSSVKIMSYMFERCSQLTSLDLSDWDTSKVTYMSYMFYNCSQLTSIDLSGWDTSKVTNMSYMFNGCSQLTNLDLSKWDTSWVIDMSRMFLGCSQLTTTVNITMLPSEMSSSSKYSSMFYNAATAANAQITVNFTSENGSLVDEMIKTKSSNNSKVSKGIQISPHTITISDNEDIEASTTTRKYYQNVRVTLTSKSGKTITSFDMNGETITGNTFKMPNDNVTITNVVYAE